MMRTRSGLIFELFIEQGGDDTILHFCTYFSLEFWISAGVPEGTALAIHQKHYQVKFHKLFSLALLMIHQFMTQEILCRTIFKIVSLGVL